MQSTLDKTRALSQALHPVVLDDAGLEGALKSICRGLRSRRELRFIMKKRARAAWWIAMWRFMCIACCRKL